MAYPFGAFLTSKPHLSRSVFANSAILLHCSRNKSRIEIGIFSDAIKKYITRNNKNIQLLIQYAEKFRIQKKIREYLEVLI